MRHLWLLLGVLALVSMASAQTYNCCLYHTSDCLPQAGCTHGCMDIGISNALCCPADAPFCDGNDEEAPNPDNLTAEDETACVLCNLHQNEVMYYGSCLKCSGAQIKQSLNGIIESIKDIPTNFINGVKSILDGIYETIRDNVLVQTFRSAFGSLVRLITSAIKLFATLLVIAAALLFVLEVWLIVISFQDRGLGGLIVFLDYNWKAVDYLKRFVYSILSLIRGGGTTGT